MVSGATEARSNAALAATAPRSMAETDARAPPGNPSPRLPPIHSAMGVRAPDTTTISSIRLSDKGLLLMVEDSLEISGKPWVRHGAVIPMREGGARYQSLAGALKDSASGVASRAIAARGASLPAAESGLDDRQGRSLGSAP